MDTFHPEKCMQVVGGHCSLTSCQSGIYINATPVSILVQKQLSSPYLLDLGYLTLLLLFSVSYPR